jgi:hypothetical protein
MCGAVLQASITCEDLKTLGHSPREGHLSLLHLCAALWQHPIAHAFANCQGAHGGVSACQVGSVEHTAEGGRPMQSTVSIALVGLQGLQDTMVSNSTPTGVNQPQVCHDQCVCCVHVAYLCKNRYVSEANTMHANMNAHMSARINQPIQQSFEAISLTRM